MTEIARLRPEPIPALHPIPEYLATGDLVDRYEDVKEVLQVPWVGVLMLAYAHYPAFFARLWEGLRPVCASRAFVDGASELRQLAEANAAALGPGSILPDLERLGYAPRELDGIRAQIEVFCHGNHLYFPIALIARALMEGESFGTDAEPAPFESRHAPDLGVPFVLMEGHHADQPTRALYDDIKATLGLPFVNTDYRALARWPSYFRLAWNGIKALVGSARYEAYCAAYHARGLEIVSALPNPSGLAAAHLRDAAQRDASPAELVECTRLFAFLLPGLTLNVALMQGQLRSPSTKD